MRIICLLGVLGLTGGGPVATAPPGPVAPLSTVVRIEASGEDSFDHDPTHPFWRITAVSGPGDKPLRFDGLAPGRYVVTVTVPNGEGDELEGSAEIDVQAGVETPLEVKVKRKREL